MAIIQQIESSQTALCGSLHVEDTTEYGVTPESRIDFGIAVFVSTDPGNGFYTNDPSFSDLSNPGTVDIPSSWDIDIPNSLTQGYEINAYWTSVWSFGTYVEGVVLFHDENFYVRTAIGTGEEEPGSGTEWTLLTINDVAIFEADISLVKFSNYQDVTACPSYVIMFKECNGIHRIVDNSENDNAKRFYVTYYNGSEVISETSLNQETRDIQLPEDHIYILTIEEEVATDNWQEVAVLPIYEFCVLKNCTNYLTANLLCNNQDPCCENCDDTIQKKQEMQRFQLNQILLLYSTLLGYIHEESIEYLGIIEMEADRLTYMENIQQIFEKIQGILERCELCMGALQTSTFNTTNQGSDKPCNC